MPPTDSMEDIGRALIAVMPAHLRPYFVALVTFLLGVQRACTFINARLPTSAFQLPGWRGGLARAIYRVATSRAHDEAGTVKSMGSAMRAPEVELVAINKRRNELLTQIAAKQDEPSEPPRTPTWPAPGMPPPPTEFNPTDTVRSDMSEEERAALRGRVTPDQTGQKGSVTVRVLIAAVCFTLAAFTGCPVASDLAMRASPGLPDPNGCTPNQGRCIDFQDSGYMLPVQCSSTRREWPALPRDGLGNQRTCALHEGCRVNDAGIASCTPMDGGF